MVQARYIRQDCSLRDAHGGSLAHTIPARQRTGFTLVELLVVIAIIGLLIAILIPTLSRAREQARSITCRANLREIMQGMSLYITDEGAFPGTHSLFHLQSIFTTEWPRPAGVTWDGARDRIVGLNVTKPYTEPVRDDVEFREHVPLLGTLFPYIKSTGPYVCPSDHPGSANDAPDGGGGNGRLSYSLNGYVGYQPPERLARFTYIADALDNPLPGGEETRSFRAGDRVNFAPASFMTMFEEHPKWHINGDFPDGNFNGLDRVATRHGLRKGNKGAMGRPSIAFLDGHVEGPELPAGTDGKQLFASYGQPFLWHASGPPDQANVAMFIKRLSRDCPWR